MRTWICGAERRHTAVCVAQNRLSRSRAPSFSLVFSQPPLNPGKNRTLERAQSPPAYPFFHIAEYKLCPGCADLDRAPLRIRARLNLRIKLARVFSDSDERNWFDLDRRSCSLGYLRPCIAHRYGKRHGGKRWSRHKTRILGAVCETLCCATLGNGPLSCPLSLYRRASPPL